MGLGNSRALRYGLAIAAFLAATGLSVSAGHYGFRNVEVPLYLFAIAISAWYAGTGPAAVVVVLSIIFFDYFFTEPRYSLSINPAELPYFGTFVAFAFLVAWFSAVRRRVERELLEARDKLQADISERRRREDEIQSLNQELAKHSTALESTNKELEAFAYSISHDLRAPLRHMAGYTELLQKKASATLDEKANHYILMILESAKRMGSLIDDLLSFSRISRSETQKTLVSLEQLLREALSEVQEETSGRAIAWKIGALPEFYGDRSMLRLVFVNLLSNAIKFTRTRREAEIEIGSAGEGGDEVVVFVRDNGVGFDMKYANKLFGVFQRLHQSEAFEGTGIGLATVQRIIHRHGGRVWAEGSVDHGATFYFSAPKAQGETWQTRAH